MTAELVLFFSRISSNVTEDSSSIGLPKTSDSSEFARDRDLTGIVFTRIQNFYEFPILYSFFHVVNTIGTSYR